nr:hypothetical protein BaRGS_031389 [Batillaria attramentaria]
MAELYKFRSSSLIVKPTLDLPPEMKIRKRGKRGTCLSPFLFSLYTADCRTNDDDCLLDKYADDTALTGRMTGDDDTHYRHEIERFVEWNKLEKIIKKAGGVVGRGQESFADSLEKSVIGQRFDFRNQLHTLDTIHGYRAQYDDRHDIFIFLNRDNCVIVEADDDTKWDAVVQDHDQFIAFTEQVYHQISTNTSVTSMTHREAIEAYHSSAEGWECSGKDVFKVTYQEPSN